MPLEEAEEEDEELLEDASELGEDEDDMAEVIENVEEEEAPRAGMRQSDDFPLAVLAIFSGFPNFSGRDMVPGP